MDEASLKKEILMQFPLRFRKFFDEIAFGEIQEIRFRASKPLMIYSGKEAYFVTDEGRKTFQQGQAKVVTKEELAELFAAFCDNSVYAFRHEICDGFLTLAGGHRVGISGRCVLKGNEITHIADISGLNLRIAKEYIGCAQKVLPLILRPDKTVANTVFIAPPQGGKTTFLRDLSRLLSERFKVTVVDERSEIAAIKDGIAQFCVGVQTDVLDRFPKAMGMICAIRSLSPEVLITDELGGAEDLLAVKSVMNAGCRIITSMHGDSADEFVGEKRRIYELFDRAVILKRKDGIPQVEVVIDISNQMFNGGK